MKNNRQKNDGANVRGFEKTDINWFPGHMAKTRRLIKENLKYVDIVIELLDARIPISSKNPDIAAVTENKPLLTVLNKSSIADPAVTKRWLDSCKANGGRAVAVDCVKNENIGAIGSAAREILKEKIEKNESRGMAGKKLRAMIVGIPNVGKSSLVNRLGKAKKAKVEDRPGVTRDKQWVTTDLGFDLLDMPGVLWPKFEDKIIGENLALTGAIKDAVLDIEELGAILCKRLISIAPDKLTERYKLDGEKIKALEGWQILEEIGRKRGFIVSGGEVNTERAAIMLLDEFRGCKIGRISLETPEDR